MVEVSTGLYLLGPEKTKRKRPPVAHVWDGTDTLCRMWSTGGMYRGGDWRIVPSPEGRRLCAMCTEAPEDRREYPRRHGRVKEEQRTDAASGGTVLDSWQGDRFQYRLRAWEGQLHVDRKRPGNLTMWERMPYPGALVSRIHFWASRGHADDFDRVISEYLEWSLRQFPQSTPASVAAHLEKEVRELRADPESAEELADIVALCFHSAARQGLDLTATLAAKLPVLKARCWGEPDADGVVEHVRDQPE